MNPEFIWLTDNLIKGYDLQLDRALYKLRGLIE